MRRRTFLAAVPAVAVGAALRAQTRKGRASAPAPSDEGRTAAFQPSGEEKFDRPDVHAGDRPVGASFGSRSAVYGRSRAPPGPRIRWRRWPGSRCCKKGGSAVDAAIAINACLGFLEPTSSGIGGDCFAMLWDPAQNKVVGLAGSGRSPRALTLETVRVAGEERRAAAAGRGRRLGAGRGRRLVDAAPALRPAEMGRAVRAGDRLCRGRRAGARGDRLLHAAQPRRLSAGPARASRRPPTRSTPMAQGPPASARCSATPISPAPTG